MNNKQYLGDSVYVEHDNFGLTLTTENGYGPSNTIYLEPEVYEALLEYVSEQKRRAKAETGPEAAGVTSTRKD